MPQVLELRIIDNEVWARVGHPEKLPSGCALYTPTEIENLKAQIRTAAFEDIKEAIDALPH